MCGTTSCPNGKKIKKRNFKKKKSLLPEHNRLAGFLLKSPLSKDWASGLRYSGIPNFAFSIWFIVSFRFSPWNGNWPVSISNCNQCRKIRWQKIWKEEKKENEWNMTNFTEFGFIWQTNYKSWRFLQCIVKFS